MSRPRECFDPLCCPVGLREHIQHYRYLREVTDITLREYWWHEFKSLIGLNRMSKEDRAELEADDTVSDMVSYRVDASTESGKSAPVVRNKTR